MENVTESEISMVLDTYMYLNYVTRDGMSLRETMEIISRDENMCLAHPHEIEILMQATLNPQIGNLTINCQSQNMGFDAGTNASTFISPDNRNVYMAYRGTHDGEWLDNGRGLSKKETLQQKRAQEYYEKSLEVNNIKKEQHLVITGHSKGGNKAQFVTMNSDKGEYIDACYSIDGQGHSKEAVDNWQNKYSEEEYKERTGKIFAINGENDYVSVLGTCIVPLSHIFYVKTPAAANDLAAYHDITRMFANLSDNEDGSYTVNYSGKKNPYVLSRGTLGDLSSMLSSEVMDNPNFVIASNADAMMQMAEILGGGILHGLNGERAAMNDWGIFAISGINIISSVLGDTDEGKNVIEKFKSNGEYNCKVNENDSFYVNANALAQRSSELGYVIRELGALLDEAKYAQNKIPLIINQIPAGKYKLGERQAQILYVKDRLYELSTKLNNIVNIYLNCDRNISIT